MSGEFVTKRIKYETDVLIQKCKLELMKTKWYTRSKREVLSDYMIIDTAVRIYYAVLRGLIPEDVVMNALEELMVTEATKEIKEE